MRIECLTTFLDGRDRFEAGDIRHVEDEKARVFIANGWAKGEDGQVNQSAGSVELEVHSASISQESKNG